MEEGKGLVVKDVNSQFKPLPQSQVPALMIWGVFSTQISPQEHIQSDVHTMEHYVAIKNNEEVLYELLENYFQNVMLN